MSLDEIRSSRSKCRRMVEMMDKMPSKLKGIRVHGLDKHTSAHTARRAEIRRQVNNAVFELQAFQVTQGLDIADVMAEVCRKYSLDCVSKAHEVGVLAAEEAQSF